MNAWVKRDNVVKMVEVAALVGGGYAGWTLCEGQHFAVKCLATIVGAGIAVNTASWILE
jgi:hypothetical protein